MEGALGEVAHQAAVGVEEVDVGPAVALGPVEQLPAARKRTQGAVLDVGVHPLGDDCAGGIGTQLHIADVQLLEVTAPPGEVEALPVTQPPGCPELIAELGDTALRALEFHILVLERRALHLLRRAVADVEDIEVAVRGRLARHLVLVGLQGRARIAQGIDDPEFLDLAHIPANGGEMPGVRGPDEVGREAALGGVAHGVARIAAGAICEVSHAVGGEAMLHQGAVLSILCRLAQVGGVHIEDVAVLHIHAHGAVRRHAGPARVLALLLLRAPAQVAVGDAVAEAVLLLVGALEIELEITLVLAVYAHAPEREMIGIIRVAGNLRQAHRQLVIVENCRPRAVLRIHEVVIASLGV